MIQLYYQPERGEMTAQSIAALREKLTRDTIEGNGTNAFKLKEDRKGAWMQSSEVDVLLLALEGRAEEGPEKQPELVKRLARSFASEWLRPNDPDAATPALVDTLSTTMTAFFAATTSALERRTGRAEPPPVLPLDIA